jgi:hypothetical protein
MSQETPDDRTQSAAPVPLRTRISAARALLEEGMGGEYQYLSGRQQARIQEALEFLREAEEGFRGGAHE